jgi:Secretion system C-terminal sorting domain
MKRIIILLNLLWFLPNTHAQFVTCESMPLTLTSGFDFTTSGSFGDSMITFQISNASGTNFAYPQVKLVPLTPLPSGMSLHTINPDWAVFASSWNMGDSTQVEIYYDINSAIAPNYTVDFLLYATNFMPLSIDSCVFTDTIRINLNPIGTASLNPIDDIQWQLFPNPATDFISVQFDTDAAENWMDIYTMQGELLRSIFIQSSLQLDVSSLPNGMYVIRNRGGMGTQKLLIQH